MPPTQPPKIVLQDFNLAGLSDSAFMGAANSMESIVGFDMHTQPGVMRVAQAMVKESGAVVTDLCQHAVNCSDGNSYWFSYTSGKIWKRTSAGAWSLIYTTIPAAGSAGCLGAHEYQGYIYWATQSRLHRITVGNAATWNSPALNYQTFGRTDAEFHPMTEVNLVLYIGDADYVAQIDATALGASAASPAWSSNALDIPQPYRIKCLGRTSTTLIIGTIINSSISEARVFQWNTWSLSWTIDASVHEVGVNSFIVIDNLVLVSCGLAGNLYYFDLYGYGQSLKLYKRIPGTYDAANTATINPSSSASLNGITLIGFSYVSGTASRFGIYGLGHFSEAYPLVLDLPYPLSPSDSLTNIQVGAMLVTGSTLIASWQSGSSFGVDALSSAQKTTRASLDSRYIAVNRDSFKNFAAYNVSYELLPDGTDIQIWWYDVKTSSWNQFSDVRRDNDRQLLFKQLTIPRTKFRISIVPVVSGNLAPQIETISIDLQ